MHMAKRTIGNQKQPLNFLIDRKLAQRVYDAVDAFGGRKRLGTFMAAAATMFLEQDARVQRDYLGKVLAAELDSQLDAFLAQPMPERPRRPSTGSRDQK
jgi:hypothetical protein